MRYLFSFLVMTLLILPSSGLAQGNDNNNFFGDEFVNPVFNDSGINTTNQSDSGLNTTNQSDSGVNTTQTNNSGGGVTIQNPLAADSITDFFLLLIEILLIFAIPIIVFFIILAGFKFVTAQGNESQLGEAKRALLYAIVGGLLILGAYIILEVIQATVNSFTV